MTRIHIFVTEDDVSPSFILRAIRELGYTPVRARVDHDHQVKVQNPALRDVLWFPEELGHDRWVDDTCEETKMKGFPKKD